MNKEIKSCGKHHKESKEGAKREKHWSGGGATLDGVDSEGFLEEVVCQLRTRGWRGAACDKLEKQRSPGRRNSKRKGPKVGTGWVLQEEPEAIKTRTKDAMGQVTGEMRAGEGQTTQGPSLGSGCHSEIVQAVWLKPQTFISHASGG